MLVGPGVKVAVGGRGVLVGSGVTDGPGVFVRVGVLVGRGVLVRLGVGDGPMVLVRVGVFVGRGVGDGPAVLVGAGVFVGAGVLVGRGVKVAVGTLVGKLEMMYRYARGTIYASAAELFGGMEKVLPGRFQATDRLSPPPPSL